jgi:two-component system, NarL family, nitrate/nitrite response regulator NarL
MIAMSTEIRILIIDDHSLFRESLSRLLQTESDLKIAATSASVTEALALPELTEIDLVLLDYDLGPEQGTQFLDRARGAGFEGRILMVTAGMSDGAMFRALESGSSGVFLKHSSPNRLVEAIRKVVAGEVWLDPAVTRTIIAAASGQTAAPRRTQSLTQREQTVLKGVFEGLTNKEIGARLSISESSVKAVLQQLFEKTGVRTRSQLVRIAIEKHSDDWLGNPS